MARVGIDLDGVVYDFVDAYRSLLEFQAPRRFECPEPTRWRFFEDWGIKEQDFLQDLKYFDSIFADGKPYPGAEQALVRLLDNGHTLVFITDRSINPRAEQITRDWLDRFLFPYADYELHITADKSSVPVDYFIDDKPENVQAMLDAGVRAHLCDRDWNQDATSLDGVTYTLEEFAEMVLERERTNQKLQELSELTELIVTNPTTGGMKGKKLARFDLIPVPALKKVAEVYGKGAEKYAPWNWRQGYDWSLSIAALDRHWNDFKDGKSYHEDGHSLASVVFHALALMTFEEEHPELDDRFKRPA